MKKIDLIQEPTPELVTSILKGGAPENVIKAWRVLFMCHNYFYRDNKNKWYGDFCRSCYPKVYEWYKEQVKEDTEEEDIDYERYYDIDKIVSEAMSCIL